MLDAAAVPPYLVEHVAAVTSPDPAVREAYTCLAVSENKLMWDLLDEKANAVRGVGPASFGYAEHWGSERFRRTISDFASGNLWNTAIGPESIVTMAGAGATLEALFANLCDEGTGVLIPTPSYAGYWLDIETRVGLIGVGAPTAADNDFALTPEDLEAAFASAPCPIAALLITNPPNPTGRILDDEEILDAVAWGRAKGLHVVVNELYGLSAHSGRPFRSIAALLDDRSDDVHLVWGFSKDFAASGLRCGVLATDNEDLLHAMRGHAMFSVVSGDTQHLLATMLEDDAWVERYLAEMRSRLASAHGVVSDVLAGHEIGVVPADAGLFVFADLRPFLSAPTWEAEAELWRTMLDRTSVNLTPGSACRSPEPGFFRVCFATVPEEVLADRLDEAVSAIR